MASLNRAKQSGLKKSTSHQRRIDLCYRENPKMEYGRKCNSIMDSVDGGHSPTSLCKNINRRKVWLVRAVPCRAVPYAYMCVMMLEQKRDNERARKTYVPLSGCNLVVGWILPGLLGHSLLERLLRLPPAEDQVVGEDGHGGGGDLREANVPRSALHNDAY
jgi:hypothetical protein